MVIAGNKPWKASVWGRGTYRQIKTGAGFKLKNKNGPFSAVWTATIARLASFCSIFRDLQDSHSFAPLQTQILQFFAEFRKFFENFIKISKFLRNSNKFDIFRRNVHGIFPEFQENSDNYS